jgi:hypothetical protein
MKQNLEAERLFEPVGMDSPTRPINLIFGAGYQFAVTSNPVTANNWVATARITF